MSGKNNSRRLKGRRLCRIPGRAIGRKEYFEHRSSKYSK
jgi:hypothetical protein